MKRRETARGGWLGSVLLFVQSKTSNNVHFWLTNLKIGPNSKQTYAIRLVNSNPFLHPLAQPTSAPPCSLSRHQSLLSSSSSLPPSSLRTTERAPSATSARTRRSRVFLGAPLPSCSPVAPMLASTSASSSTSWDSTAKSPIRCAR